MAGVVSVIGVPSSAGSYAAGQDQAPGALRAAGLFAALAAAGVDARDAGDLPEQVWAPDRANRRAQNSEQVVASLTELTGRVAELLAEDTRVLVLGGNCTVALGAMAGMRRVGWERTGLLYVDRHFDLNTPETTIDGALDWMGLAHGLDLDGCVDALAGAFGPRPLLRPEQIAFLGTDPDRSTGWERAQLAELDLAVTPQADLVADPAAAASAALRGAAERPADRARRCRRPGLHRRAAGGEHRRAQHRPVTGPARDGAGRRRRRPALAGADHRRAQPHPRGRRPRRDPPLRRPAGRAARPARPTRRSTAPS